MAWVRIAELGRHAGEEVTLKGWLYSRRSSGKVHFLTLRDGSGLCQCVASPSDLGAERFAAADHLRQETALEATGVVRADTRAPGGFELALSDYRVIAGAADYPLTPKEHGVGYLLELRHLWLRSPRQRAILKVRAEVVAACRDFLDRRGFVLFDTPVLTPTSCEGTTTLFEIDYFGERKAYLTQSGQLYAEAGAMALGRVYCFGPVFRAEKSKTRRHLTEFCWPSMVSRARSGTPSTRTVSAASPRTTMGRSVRRCGQIGVTTMASTSGVRMGPLAASV